MNRSKTEHGIYRAEPIRTVSGIPVFSEPDFYIANYQAIARDHVDSFEKTGKNPFMDEDHWRELEDSTVALIRKYSVNAANILDVGVGMGRILDKFPELERYGIDIAMPYLEHSKAKGINVALSLVEDMPYERDYFDCIVCTDVLEHVFDLNLAFMNIIEVLKPGGFLIARVPYREDLGKYFDLSYPYDFAHVRNFDEFSIRLLVEKIFNLKLTEWQLCGFISGNQRYRFRIQFARRIFRWMLRRMKVFGDNCYRSITRRVNHPVEINFVVQKIGIKNNR
jgi:SAM-dependent methyltransferase